MFTCLLPITPEFETERTTLNGAAKLAPAILGSEHENDIPGFLSAMNLYRKGQL